MPQYQVKGPDGQTYNVNAPDGASQDDVMNYVKQQVAQGGQTGGQPAPAAAPQGQQPPPGQQGGGITDILNTGMAAARGAADTATFGLSTRASAALAAGISHLIPGATPMSYSEALGNVQHMDDAHPDAKLAGNIGGAFLGGAGLLKAGAKAVPAAVEGALALKKGETALNVGRLAAKGAGAGALAGGAQGAVEGTDDIISGKGGVGSELGSIAGGAGTGAAIGAVAGTVIPGGIAGGKAALDRFSTSSKASIATLAKYLDMQPGRIAQALDDFRTSTGAPPSLLDILGAKDTANLRPVIQGRQSTAAVMQDAADQRMAALPGQVSDRITDRTTNTPFAAEPDLSAARSAPLHQMRQDSMDSAMRGVHDQAVLVDSQGADLLNNPLVMSAVRTDPALGPRVTAAMEHFHDNGGHDEGGVTDMLTVNDFERLRQAVRGRQDAALAANKPGLAREYGQTMNQIEQYAGQQVPEYGQALSDYATHSRFINGFEHSYQGKSALDAPALGDRSDFQTPEGQAGLELGARSRLFTTVNGGESKTVQTINRLRQGGTDATAENLGASETADLTGMARSQNKAIKNYDMVSGGALGSKQDEQAASMGRAATTVVAAATHPLAAFKTNAITRFLQNAQVNEPTVQKIIGMVTSTDPAVVSQLPRYIRRANLDAATQRRILGVAALKAGKGATLALRSAMATHTPDADQ